MPVAVMRGAKFSLSAKAAYHLAASMHLLGFLKSLALNFDDTSSSKRHRVSASGGSAIKTKARGTFVCLQLSLVRAPKYEV